MFIPLQEKRDVYNNLIKSGILKKDISFIEFLAETTFMPSASEVLYKLYETIGENEFFKIYEQITKSDSPLLPQVEKIYSNLVSKSC